MQRHNMCHAVVCDRRNMGYGMFEQTLPGPLFAAAEEVGLPAECGNVLVTLAECAPATSLRGAKAEPEAACHTYRWKADKPNVDLTQEDCAALDNAADCVDHPLTVATSHGVMSVLHGRPFSSLGILPHPHFRMADNTLIKRAAKAKSSAGMNRAYKTYRGLVKQSVIDSLDTCIGHGATVVYMEPVGCSPKHAGLHAHRLKTDFDTIVAECLRMHGATNKPRGDSVTCHVLPAKSV